jgi:predicted enzyme related to lactoylglutathione lyase
MSSAVLGDIGQIAIVIQDLPRATAFYRDALALPFLFEAPGLAFFQAGSVRLMLSRAEDPELDHPSSILYFNVADILEAHRILAGRGVRFRQPPHAVHHAGDRSLWIADFEDSEQNIFALMAWRPNPA